MATIYWTGGTAGDGTDWAITTNWSSGTVPVNSDDVVFDRSSSAITDNLNQSATSLNSLTIERSFTGSIGNGLDETDEYLQIGATDVIIGDGTGNGSQRLNINLGTVQAVVNIISGNSTGTDSPKAPLRIKANNVSNVIQVNGQNTNVAFLDTPTDSGALGNIDIINGSNISIGAGATYTSLTQIEGSTTSFETSGTIKISGGTLRTEGSGAISSVIQTDGTLISNSTGTITAYTGVGGTLTMTDSTIARTITTLTKSPGFTFNRNENITVTNDNFDTDFTDYTISIT